MTDVVTTPFATAKPVEVRAVRPQPLGAFPLPLGYMLIPDGDGSDAVRAELLAGRVPQSWPRRCARTNWPWPVTVRRRLLR